MVRPTRHRRVEFNPNVTFYKPAGIPLRTLDEERLKIDEVEALRLCDKEGLKQEEAAKKMGVSQPTLYRILKSAREKLARAIIDGKAIRIEKGESSE